MKGGADRAGEISAAAKKKEKVL